MQEMEGAQPTETTKANGRSNFNAEESMQGGGGFDDDDEFDKLIGRIAAPNKPKVFDPMSSKDTT
jgi:hypothetical protein